jgi:hypothetical protein
MEIKKLNEDLFALVEIKSKLSTLDYSDEAYDELEEELHDLEDEFLSNYGTYIEDALHVVHDEFCPDDDVLSPIAYIPNIFKIKGQEVSTLNNEGVPVMVDDIPHEKTRLALLPNPTRILLLIGAEKQDVVWVAK